MVGNAISSIWNSIKNWFTDGVNSIVNAVKSMASKVSEFFGNIINSAKEKLGQIGTVVSNGFQGAIDFITSLPGKALEWGSDFIGGIADGIKSAIGAVTDAVGDVVDTIASYLHFSRPDKGPLHEYEKWMPDMMSGIADGIYNNIDKVKNAVNAVSATMNNTISGNIDGMVESAAATNNQMITIEGDTIILNGEVIGKTAERVISTGQRNAMAAKGRRK